MNRLREHRERHGLTQDDVVARVHRRALERGDIVPGLDRVAFSKHETGAKRPGPYYRSLYCAVFGVSPAELGFRLALPDEEAVDDVDRREFLTGAAGLMAAAFVPGPAIRLGEADITRLRQSVTSLYALDQQHGGTSAYETALRVIGRLRRLAEHASYSQATGRALRELIGLTAEQAGWMAFDAGHHDDARRWWLEALHWGRLAETPTVEVVALASMSRQASDLHRPGEAIDLAVAAQRAAGSSATPRLTSMLLAREAVGHAGRGDRSSAHAGLSRARQLVDHDRGDDPGWLDFYDQASFAGHEYHVAVMLGDLPAAEEAARAGLELNDPVGYPRGSALYLVQLAAVLVRRGEIDEAVAVATRAMAAAADLDSGRVTHGLRVIARELAPFRDEAAVSEFLARSL